MGHPSPRLQRAAWLFALILLGAALVFLSEALPQVSGSAAAQPFPQATPVCTLMPCDPPAQCQYPYRAYGYQPQRYETVSPILSAAASNSLDVIAPTYPPIYRGVPGSPVPVNPIQPIPHIVLRAIAWHESRWKQFANDMIGNPDNLDRCYCTLVGIPNSGDQCGHGLMQITSGMENPSGWFDRGQVSSNLLYNLAIGVNMAIQKWNEAWPYLGNNEYTVLDEGWYYAVTGYNGWGGENNPNNPDPAFYSDRPPYSDRASSSLYPYQEVIWGRMAHPGIATDMAGEQRQLWRPTRPAWVPRGIWGQGPPDHPWWPPRYTSRAVIHLLRGIEVTNRIGPTIILTNTTGITLAADVILYNNDHSFSRWWLGAPPNDNHQYPYTYIRLRPYATLDLSVAAVFTSTAFSGYARISASEGVAVALRSAPPPPAPYKLFLPVAFKDHRAVTFSSSQDLIQNGGFEEFTNGRPKYWEVSSPDNYPLADSTWFYSGHYGAYLGGYDDLGGQGDRDDTLAQTADSIPYDAIVGELCYSWYILSGTPVHNDAFYTYLKFGSTDVVSATKDSYSPRNNWYRDCLYFDPQSYAGQRLRLSFEADMSKYDPASFFVDDVRLTVLTGP